MPAYSGGTVWLQVVPSFDGLQQALRRGVAGAFAGSGINKAANDAFKGVERQADEAGTAAGKKFSSSFERLTGDRIKRISKDFDALKNSLPEKEFRQIRAVLNDISKLDLSKATGQARARDDIAGLRRQFQGLLDEADKGQRRLSDPARWNLGAIRQQADEIGESIRRWSAPDPVRLKVDRESVRGEMAAIRNEIRALQTDVQVGADVSEANTKISALQARLEQLDRDKVDIGVDVDTFGAMLQLRRLQAQVNAANRGGGARASLMGLLDAGAAANAVRVFNGALFATVAIGPLLIPVLAAITAGILGVGAAALGAVLGIGVLVAGLSGIGGAVGAMAELDRARRLDRGGAGNARDAAAERRRAVQDARSVADAQKQLARARRDGARAIQDADRRVIDAERDLARAHEDAAEAASDAADRVADARQALSRANYDAARAAEDAADRVADAERRLTDVQREAREAQQGLNEARQQARRDLIDLQNTLDSAQLSERSLTFQVEEAAVHLNVVLEDDQATQRERDKAQLRYDQAVESLEQQQLETRRLEDDVKKADRAGVEGSDRVRDAKQRIRDANRGVRDAEEAVRDAREAADRQAIDSARQLADAREAVTDAIKDQTDAAEDSAQRISDAERSLSDARQSRADAERNAAESVADAQLALARTHEDIALRAHEASLGTDSLATATDNLNEALLGLSPAGVAFATWLYSLKPLLDDIRFAAQEGLLPGLQSGLAQIVDEYGPSFVRFVGAMAQVMGDLAEEFGSLLVNDPIWREFFSMMNDLGPVFLRQFGDASINLATGFAAIMTAFAPFMVELGDGLVSLTDRFSDWGSGLEGSSGLQSFFNYLREATPEVNHLIGNLFEILTDLFIGLAPYADSLLQSLIGFTDWLAAMDPDEIARIALGIGALILAVQTLALAMSAISGTLGLVGGVVNLAGGIGTAAKGLGGGAAKGAAGRGAAPATAAALDGVGVAAGGAGKRLIGFLGPVGLAVSIVWLLWDAARFLDDQFGLLGGTTDEVSEGMSDAWNWLWRRGIKPVWDLIAGVLDLFGQMFRTVANIVDQVFRHIIAPAFRWLWESTIGPWWEDNVRPVLSTFSRWIKENLPDAVRSGVNLIADIWNRMLNIFRSPIKAMIEIVWNQGIIGSFNWLADKVPGMTPIEEIEVPASLYPNGKKFATGGIIPGYTPGRDVHRFVSPTAGVLDLSGGEPILRPEAGKVLGPDWVHGINAAARKGGTGGVQRFLGYEAHADGGFFGDVWDSIKGVGNALKDPIGWFEQLAEGALRSWGVEGVLGDAVTGTVMAAPRAIGDWITSLLGAGRDQDLAGGGDPVSGNAMGWKNQWNIIKSAFPGASLFSAYRPGAITATGYPSYHGMGRAIDITPSMAMFNWLASKFPFSTELIYSPANNRQLYKGRQTLFGEPTRGDHWDHIHWAMANGGILPKLYDDGGDVPPGLSLVANASGRVESTVTDAFMAEVRNLGRRRRGDDAPVVDARGATFGAMPEEIVDEWNKQRHDNMALAGILDEPGVF